jgi:glycosyltransferase involved in cell wall biosynthesis
VNAPAISVLIPTFNYSRYLPEAIESVLSQDFPDFELIIADDCSSDDTAEVVKPYCQRDSRIQFIAHPANMGMVNNWNYCLERAQGEYIKFIFGDDKLCGPNALGRMLAMLKSDPAATLAASARVILDENSKVVNLWRNLPEGSHDGRKIIKACLMKNGQNLVGEPSVVLFRKADARRGFNTAYRQIVDVEMWFHLLEKGNLVYTREPLCAFRCHAKQQTEVNTASGVASREHIVFFTHYATQPWLPRRAALPYLLHLRRKLRKNPGANAAELRGLEQQLLNRLGKWGWLTYLAYYIQYRITKPFINFYDSIKKRMLLRRYKQPQ